MPENSSPMALNRPGSGGMTTLPIASSLASPAAWMGPAPPKATNVNSRGSRPRSVDTWRSARMVVALAIW